MRERYLFPHCRLNLAKTIIAAIFLITGLLNSALAQDPSFQQITYPDSLEEDTTQYTKPVNLAKLDSAYHSPTKAALFSAALPGLGQIYNRKYWKVPLVYGGFVFMGYLIHRNQKEYKIWRQAYIDYGTPDFYLPDINYEISKEYVNNGKNFYKRQKELSIIGTVGFYVLQILDASVDAHLFDWSVGEDISFNVEPGIKPAPYATAFGLSACISF